MEGEEEETINAVNKTFLKITQVMEVALAVTVVQAVSISTSAFL